MTHTAILTQFFMTAFLLRITHALMAEHNALCTKTKEGRDVIDVLKKL
jgi:hypothetical protein